MTAIFDATTTTTLRGLGFSVDDTVAAEFSSESFNSLFYAATQSSSDYRTDPDSSLTIDSSDEHRASIYSDAVLQINHFDPYLGLADDTIEFTDFIPWPSPHADSQDSLSSPLDRSYETDFEDHCGTTTRTRPQRKLRRTRAHHIVARERREPSSKRIITFIEAKRNCNWTQIEVSFPSSHGPDNHLPSDQSAAQSGLESPQEQAEDGFASDDEYASRQPADYDLDLADDYDGPIEYIVEHVQPTIGSIPALTTTELAGLGLGLPSFDESSRLTRLTANDDIAEEVSQVASPAHHYPALTFGPWPAMRPVKFGRFTSFESVDLNLNDADADAGVAVSAPPTPDLRPWTASEDSPSPILLSSPVIFYTVFRIADVPELSGPPACT